MMSEHGETRAAEAEPPPDNSANGASARAGPRQAQVPWLRSHLVSLGSAAVIAIYSAGLLRTRAAAETFELAEAGHRVPAPLPRTAVADDPAASSSPALTASAERVLESRDLRPNGVAGTWTAVPAPPQGDTVVQSDGVNPPTPTGQESSPASEPAPTAAYGATSPDTSGRSPAESTRASTPASVAVASAASQATLVDPAAAASAPVAPLAEASASAATGTTAPAAANPAGATSAAAAPPAPAAVTYKDGVYTGWGNSRHGRIQASVEIRGGRIVDASITQCRTRYPCSWVEHLPPQVVQRQSEDVDYVSGATQSANAFYYAVLEALSQAK
jgi:uncharacterized protein with FMN-binding domain